MEYHSAVTRYVGIKRNRRYLVHKITALILLLPFLVFRSSFVEHKPAVQATYYGGSQMDSPKHAVVLDDGSILVVGSTLSTDG